MLLLNFDLTVHLDVDKSNVFLSWQSYIYLQIVVNSSMLKDCPESME